MKGNMKGNNKQIEFKCIQEDCQQPILFRLLEIEDNPRVKCPSCNKEYSFNNDFLERLRKFEMLVCAIREARDILSDVNIAINVKNHQVRIPYYLLLTRMNTLLTLNIGNRKVVFSFRVEPLQETADMG